MQIYLTREYERARVWEREREKQTQSASRTYTLAEKYDGSPIYFRYENSKESGDKSRVGARGSAATRALSSRDSSLQVRRYIRS